MREWKKEKKWRKKQFSGREAKLQIQRSVMAATPAMAVVVVEVVAEVVAVLVALVEMRVMDSWLR